MCDIIIIPTLSTLAGATIGSIIGFFTTRHYFNKITLNTAIENFRSCFIDEVVIIKKIMSEFPNIIIFSAEHEKLFNKLYSAKNKHFKAVETIKFYVRFNKYKRIEQAYNNYYNPRNLDKPSNIHVRSFDFYKTNNEFIKKTINRDISGIELAFENIKKILDEASK